MGFYLNSISPYKKYKAVAEDTYFVDKTLADDLRQRCEGENAGVCGNCKKAVYKRSDLFCYGHIWAADL